MATPRDLASAAVQKEVEGTRFFIVSEYETSLLGVHQHLVNGSEGETARYVTHPGPILTEVDLRPVIVEVIGPLPYTYHSQS